MSADMVARLRDRLLEQGAHLGTIDAFDAAVRKLEDDYVARAIRHAATDPEYSLHGDGATALVLDEAARQIEGLRR